MRENVEVLLVAMAVAMGIRTFFVQPFKIPTGSDAADAVRRDLHQSKGPSGRPNPGSFVRVYEACVRGKFYHHAVAAEDGEVVDVGPPEHIFRFFNKITLYVHYNSQPPEATTPITFWLTPDNAFAARAGLVRGEPFHKGDDIVKFEEVAGTTCSWTGSRITSGIPSAAKSWFLKPRALNQ